MPEGASLQGRQAGFYGVYFQERATLLGLGPEGRERLKALLRRTTLSEHKG